MKLRIMVGAVALAFALPASATEIQAEYGQCRFDAAHNGTFYQEGRYTQNYLTPDCASLGIAGRFVNRNYGYRAFGIVTGYMQNRDNVATYRDDEIDTAHGSCGPMPDGHNCMTTHNGSGNMVGIGASLVRYIDLPGNWQVTGELGFLIHRVKYYNGPKFLGGPNDGAPAGDFKHDERTNDFLGTLPSTFVGVTLRWRQVYVFARHYSHSGGRGLSLTKDNMTNIGVGYAIPIKVLGGE